MCGGGGGRGRAAHREKSQSPLSSVDINTYTSVCLNTITLYAVFSPILFGLCENVFSVNVVMYIYNCAVKTRVGDTPPRVGLWEEGASALEVSSI